MKLYDIDTGDIYSLPVLKQEWETYRKAEPWNHAETFPAELYVIVMDTINGRNDCDIIGFKPSEISGFLARLYSKIKGD